MDHEVRAQRTGPGIVERFGPTGKEGQDFSLGKCVVAEVAFAEGFHAIVEAGQRKEEMGNKIPLEYYLFKLHIKPISNQNIIRIIYNKYLHLNLVNIN